MHLLIAYLATASPPPTQPDHRLVGFIVCAVIAVIVWLAAKRNALLGAALIAVMIWLANGLRTV